MDRQTVRVIDSQYRWTQSGSQSDRQSDGARIDGRADSQRVIASQMEQV